MADDTCTSAELATHLGFTWPELTALNDHALAAAWCGEEEKRRLSQLIHRGP